MEKLKSSKTIALLATALLVASLFWLLNTKRVNNSLETGLQNEKLKSEQLLSEKLQLEKELQKFKDQLFSLRDQNHDLDNTLKNLASKLASQEADYNRMKKENLSLAQLKKQRQELIALQSQLENELQSLRNSYALLKSENADLSNMVASLEERNRLLSDDLNRAMFAAVDQSQIQALKGKNEKLTVQAKRTKKLIANFQVPSKLGSLSFRVIDPSGSTLSSNDGTIASVITPSDNAVTASSSGDVIENKLQKVEMTFTPKKKLKTGIYTVEILNENLYVGSLKVKLK